MGWHVILTRPALADLESIVAVIATSSPSTALSIGAGLVDAIFSLDFMPKRGAPMEQRPHLRKLIHRYYLIFYEVDEVREAVKVVRIWDARRDPAALELSDQGVAAPRPAVQP